VFKSAKTWAGKSLVGKLFGSSEKDAEPNSLKAGLIPGADKPSSLGLPVYPPYAKGIAASGPHEVLGTQGKLIRAIYNNLGLSAEEWKLFVVPVLIRYAEFVHLLPASEAHHHRGAGGLVRHGLEVSYWASIKADSMWFSHALTPKRRRLEPRAWRLAAFICGLLHDLGKPLVDIRVTDREGVKTWTTHEPLTHWLKKNQLETYYVHWRPDRVHNKHNSFNLMYFHTIVSGTPYQYLLDFPEVLDAMTTFLSGQDQGSLFSQLITMSDKESVRRDLKQLRFSQDEFAYGIPVERYFVEYFRHLLSNGSLAINKSPYDVVVSEAGVFVNWLCVSSRVLEALLNDGISGIPRDPETLARIMIERGLAKGKPVTAKQKAEAIFEEDAYYIYHLVGVIDRKGRETFSEDARYLMFVDPDIFFSAHVVPTNLEVRLYESLDEALGRTPSMEPATEEGQEAAQTTEAHSVDEDGSEASHSALPLRDEPTESGIDADTMLGAIGFSISDSEDSDPQASSGARLAPEAPLVPTSSGSDANSAPIELEGLGGTAVPEAHVSQQSDAGPSAEETSPVVQATPDPQTSVEGYEAVFAQLNIPDLPDGFDPNDALQLELGEPEEYPLDRLVEEPESRGEVQDAEEHELMGSPADSPLSEVDLDALLESASVAAPSEAPRLDTAEPAIHFPEGLLDAAKEVETTPDDRSGAERASDVDTTPGQEMAAASEGSDMSSPQEAPDTDHTVEAELELDELEDAGPLMVNGIEIADFETFVEEETAAGRDPMRIFDAGYMKQQRKTEHFQRKMKQRFKKANRSKTDDYDVRQILEMKENGGVELTYADVEARKLEAHGSGRTLSALGFVVPGITEPRDSISLAPESAAPEPAASESSEAPTAFVMPGDEGFELSDSDGDGLHEKALLMWPSKDDQPRNVMTQLDVIDKVENLWRELSGANMPSLPGYPGLVIDGPEAGNASSGTARRKPKQSRKQKAKQAAKQQPKQAAKQQPKQAAKQQPKQAAKQQPKQAAKQQPKQAAKQQPKQAAKQQPKQSTQVAAEELPVIMPERQDTAALRKDFDKALAGFHQVLRERCHKGREDLTPALYLSRVVLAVVKGEAPLGSYLYRADGGKKDAALYRLRYPSALEKYADVGLQGVMLNARDLAWALHNANLIVDHGRGSQAKAQPVALDPEEGAPAIRIAKSVGDYIHWLVLASERLAEAGVEIEASVLDGNRAPTVRHESKPAVHKAVQPQETNYSDTLSDASTQDDSDDEIVVRGPDAEEKAEIEAIGKDKKKAKQFIFRKIKHEVMSGGNELLPDEQPVVDANGNIRISKRIIGSALRKYPELRITRSAVNMYIRSNRNALKATTDTQSVIFFGGNHNEV